MLPVDCCFIYDFLKLFPYQPLLIKKNGCLRPKYKSLINSSIDAYRVRMTHSSKSSVFSVASTTFERVGKFDNPVMKSKITSWYLVTALFSCEKVFA